MTKWIVAGLAVLAFAVPTTASAAPFTPEMNLAYALAIRYWGEPTQCGEVQKSVVPKAWLEQLEGEPAGGAATQPRPGETVPSCVLYIAANEYGEEGFPMMCAVMAHEVGHLTGHGHDTDPASIMTPGSFATTPDCEQERRIWFAGLQIGVKRFYARDHCRHVPKPRQACWAYPRRLSDRLHELHHRYWAPLLNPDQT